MVPFSKGLFETLRVALINIGDQPSQVEVRLLDTFPHFRELGPKEIIAMGGFGTVSAEDFLRLYSTSTREDIEKKVREILLQAVVRGYASMTTSAAALFTVKGSRVVDLFLTAFPFGSYMVLSQRFVPVDRPKLPSWVSKDVKSFVREEIKVYKELTEMGIRLEEARGILGLGTPTHMLAVLPLESIANLIRWGGDHPEIRELIDGMRKEVENSDLSDLLEATLQAPTMGGPFPQPFHNRELPVPGELSVLSYEWSGSLDGVRAYGEIVENIRKDPPNDWKGMVKNVVALSRVAFDHANEFGVVLGGRIPLTTFNELKRHRTIPIEVEGIYRAMERGEFYVYPSVRNRPEAREAYEWVLSGFLELDGNRYEKVYALPQAVKIGVRFRLNFAHLTAPSLFYRMRSCDRAETSMKQLVRRIPFLLRKIPSYGEAIFDVLTGNMDDSRVPLPKCVVGACPEPEYCPLIKGVRPDYNDDIHRKVRRSRKEGIS